MASPSLSLRAEHFDGFSTHLLHWTLDAHEGIGHIEADWFDDSAPDHKGTRSLSTVMRLNWIVPHFDAFAGLETQYSSAITDSGTERLTLQVGDRTAKCEVYAGDCVREERPEVAAFYRVWDPVEQAVLKSLDLPFRQANEFGQL